MHVNVFDFTQLIAQKTEPYLEFLRVPSLSVGIYVLDPGATDHQKPHSEDEVYYVASGKAKMLMGSDGDAKTFDVTPGTIIFAPARMHHSFFNITERLALLVFFSSARAGTSTQSASKPASG
ncbi:MAG TPA: cupin domain-containing protein [Terriglobales bacterium]|jgi:oxalate decarboxylase/phosphoglucose isomerase-like protein (cupin superfamily)